MMTKRLLGTNKKKTRLGLKNKNEIKETIQHIKNDTEAEYHIGVRKSSSRNC